MRHKWIENEHELDRLIRICEAEGKAIRWIDHDDGFSYITGKYAAKRWFYHSNPVTMLLTCDICGKVSTPKKIVYHPPFSYDQRKRYGLEVFNTVTRLCWSCLNKMKPLERKIDESDSLRIEISRYKRKLHETTKNNG